jgi:hypothetical protein
MYNIFLERKKMKDYTIKELDIFDKVAYVYIDDYLVGFYPYKEKHPYWAVFDQIKNGCVPIHIKQYDKIPSIGMKYEGNVFLNGENGETFMNIETAIPNGPLIEGSNEAIITVSELNKVNGCLIVFMKYKNWVNENYAALFAALMSNPRIVIEDNVDNEFDHLNDPQLIGTSKKIPEFSDFENFYSQWEGK